MQQSPPKFLEIAFSKEVVVTSLKVALLVETILALINHGAAIFISSLTVENIYKIASTYFVLYGVATYTSVKAIQNCVGTNT